jgi:beta-glucanase (GH16 family)
MDDFSSGSLDSSHWSYDLGSGINGWGNQELQEYTDDPANVNVDGDQLRITAIRNSDGSGFTSGRINTGAKMQFTYGRLEAIIKVPNVADGLWPAFWTLGYNYNEVGWPRSGEIDIMEIGQGLAITEGMVNRRVISGAHWEHEEGYATYASSTNTSEDLYLTFRNYTLDWTPSRLATFVDGEKIWEMDITSEKCVDCSEMHHPHFLLFNLAVGGLFTSTGGQGSSSAAGVASSSSSAGCAFSSAGVGSSSAGGCGGARTDISSPLPATMIVDYVKLVNNSHTILDTPSPPPISDNIFDGLIEAPFPSLAPVAAPTLAPRSDTVTIPPAIQINSPPSPTAMPTSKVATPIPSSVRGFVDPIDEDGEASFNSSPDCSDSGKGKSGSGKSGSGKGSSRRNRRLCGKSGSSKGKGSKKGGTSTRTSELSSVKSQAGLSSGAADTHSFKSNRFFAGTIALTIWWCVLVF